MGKLVQVATPAQIYETPNSVYVADFIGEVNVIDGSADPQGDDRYAITWAEGQPPLIGTTTTTFGKGDKCRFAIRPEKVAIIRRKAQRPQQCDSAARCWTSPIWATCRPITSPCPTAR